MLLTNTAITTIDSTVVDKIEPIYELVYGTVTRRLS